MIAKVTKPTLQAFAKVVRWLIKDSSAGAEIDIRIGKHAYVVSVQPIDKDDLPDEYGLEID